MGLPGRSLVTSGPEPRTLTDPKLVVTVSKRFLSDIAALLAKALARRKVTA